MIEWGAADQSGKFLEFLYANPGPACRLVGVNDGRSFVVGVFELAIDGEPVAGTRSDSERPVNAELICEAVTCASGE